MEVVDALPVVPTVVADTPKETGPALENDRLARGKLKQGGTALTSTESHKNARDRDAPIGALFIFCGQALEHSDGDSEVGHLWATIACAHGDFVHGGCTLDQAERRAWEHTGRQP